jgi:hypothetical protein
MWRRQESPPHASTFLAKFVARGSASLTSFYPHTSPGLCSRDQSCIHVWRTRCTISARVRKKNSPRLKENFFSACVITLTECLIGCEQKITVGCRVRIEGLVNAQRVSPHFNTFNPNFPHSLRTLLPIALQSPPSLPLIILPPLSLRLTNSFSACTPALFEPHF